MDGQWNWLIGRKVERGEVVDVFRRVGDRAARDDETRMLLCRAAGRTTKANDRYEDLNRHGTPATVRYEP